MTGRTLVPAVNNGLRRFADTPALARQDLAAARARVEAQLLALERSLPTLPDWRGLVRRHPALTLGAAFLTGWAIARLVTRSERNPP